MKKLLKWIIIIAVILAILLLWGLYEAPYRCMRIFEMFPIIESWCSQ